MAIRRLKGRWSAALVAAAMIIGAQGAWASGRTDGSEGSEIGHGGYQREMPEGRGGFSLALDWGAAWVDGFKDKTPIYLGLTAGYNADDWIALEVSGLYAMPSETFGLLIGPKFRWVYTDEFVPYIGVKAGPTIGKDSTHFTLSPMIGADFTVGSRVLLGLAYAHDILVGDDTENINRLGMTVGVRF